MNTSFELHTISSQLQSILSKKTRADKANSRVQFSRENSTSSAASSRQSSTIRHSIMNPLEDGPIFIPYVFQSSRKSM